MTTALQGGFQTPAIDSSHAFRALMRAIARPGTIEIMAAAAPPAPLSPAAGAALLTLADPSAPVYLAGASDVDDVRQWVRFHTGAPLVSAAECQFAVGTWSDLMPLEDYALGTPEYPDRSATLIVEMPLLDTTGSTLKGPGIKDTASLTLPETAAFQANARHFPLGLDYYFTAGDRIAALPRTTKVS